MKSSLPNARVLLTWSGSWIDSEFILNWLELIQIRVISSAAMIKPINKAKGASELTLL